MHRHAGSEVWKPLHGTTRSWMTFKSEQKKVNFFYLQNSWLYNKTVKLLKVVDLTVYLPYSPGAGSD